MAAKSYVGIYAIKPWWQRRLASLENLLVEHRVHPDLVSLAGVACTGLMGAALATSARWPLLVLTVAPLAMGRLAANALDGLVARRSGLASARGELFNECSDRLSDCLVFIGLALNSRVFTPLAVAVLVLTLLTSYLGIAAKAVGGRRQFGGFLAKADRMLYMAAFSPLALLFGSALWNWLLLAFIPALLLTLVQRWRRTSLELKQLEQKGEA